MRWIRNWTSSHGNGLVTDLQAFPSDASVLCADPRSYLSVAFTQGRSAVLCNEEQMHSPRLEVMSHERSSCYR